jgi:sorting nexin-29
MTATFGGNPATTVIVAYAPTDDKTKETKDHFYADLLKCAQDTPPHNMLIIAGDLNARIGSDSCESNSRVVGKHALHEHTNDNGSRLVEFCEATDTRPCQFKFPHPKSRIWTWQPDANRNKKDNKNRCQLDHILISGKWLNSVQNTRAFNSVSVGSDHRILCAKIKISLRAPIDNNHKRPKFDWRKLKGDDELQEKYAIEVENRFSALHIEEDDLQAKYDHFVSSIEEAAKNTVGLAPKKKPKNWVSAETIEILKSRNKSKRNRLDDHQRLSQQLLKSYEEDRVKFLEEKLHRLTEAARSNKLRTTWEVVNEISGKTKAKNKHKMKKADGTTINSPKELLNEWQNYFSALLNNEVETDEDLTIEPSSADLAINTGPFTLAEIKLAVEDLKSGKSPGCDYAITPDALKYGGEFVIEQLCRICNDVYDQEKAPSQFTTNLITPLPKKGDLTQMNNYRGISLMSVAAKVYNKVLLYRIRDPIDKILRKNQAGFRQGRGCAEQVHILRRLIEGAVDKNLDIYAVFVDFKKAFDSIKRSAMFSILRHYGIPDKIVRAINTIYNGSKSRVLVDGKLSDQFNIKTGVLQGDTLAPFLFIIVIDYVLKNAEKEYAETTGSSGFTTQPRESARRPETALFDLDFADDIALLEGGKKDSQGILERVQLQATITAKWARRVGLEINIKKTEVFSNQEHNSLDKPISSHQYIELDGQRLEWCKNFKYLGSHIASSESDIQIRKGQAWGAFWKMKDVFRSTTVPLRLKVNIFEAACISILLYGCESWIINQKLESTLNSFATNCYRIMLNIKRLDKISNQKVYEIVKRNQLALQVQQRQLRFVGHCLRRDTNDPINKYVLWAPNERHGSRGRGKPRTLYHQYIGKLINNDTPPTADEMRKLATSGPPDQARKEWRKLVADCKPLLITADR